MMYSVEIAKKDYFVAVGLQMSNVTGEVAPKALAGIGNGVALRPEEEMPLLGEACCDAASCDGSVADLVSADDGDFSMVLAGE